MAKRVDSNQKEIVACMRNLGATVAITSMVGKGFVDAVVGFRGTNYLVEIKDGKKCKSAQKLTEHEKEFHETWRGTVHIVTSVNDAVDLLNGRLYSASNYCFE